MRQSSQRPAPKARNSPNTSKSNSKPGIYIIGLARQYPDNILPQKALEPIVRKFYPENIASPSVADMKSIQTLLDVSLKTGIDSRSNISSLPQILESSPTPPTIDELSRQFRISGVRLITIAFEKALEDASLAPADITHTVAVTCTDTGNPGYDLLVAQRLGLCNDVDRVFLHELHWACENPNDARIGPALFSDGAAALVLCNGIAMKETTSPIFELLGWGNEAMAGTLDDMCYLVDPKGYKLVLSKEVPKRAVNAIHPMFERLKTSFPKNLEESSTCLKPSDCDWAMHPGGIAILKGAQANLGLTPDYIRASWEVYRNFENSSSATVLIVLDTLRKMGDGRDKVVAASFGLGLCIEMATLRRC
ncbi:thiolase-like protein [Polyplosphaeria fusca]|uniref:Thiolase-like protein n=1 Tax=Polyplosphaeria fusca TaxID=682080 RepID=A0A9P4UVY1_9PLEO|nr:thiolase-like protein [Polyplosphaeria fusca]